MGMNRTSFNRVFFEDKELYKQIDNETKKEFSFMFNRCMSRLSPMNCEVLNNKNIEGSLMVDTWSIFSERILKQPNGFEPEWYRYKKPNKTILDGFSDLEKQMLSNHYSDEIEHEQDIIIKEKNIGQIEKVKK